MTYGRQKRRVDSCINHLLHAYVYQYTDYTIRYSCVYNYYKHGAAIISPITYYTGLLKSSMCSATRELNSIYKESLYAKRYIHHKPQNIHIE